MRLKALLRAAPKQVGLEQRATQLATLQSSLKSAEVEVKTNSAALRERTAELENAKAAAAELERKNALLVRSQTAELGKMSDLKQQLNQSK